MSRNIDRRPRMAAIYAPGTGHRARSPLAWRGDVRGYRPPSGWSARANLTDTHPTTGRVLPRAEWWIIETKQQP
ncbi:hypothetical protein NB699_001546 [Xanthomonas sacchari]|uniref:hypothetical protein n=1 Tax=Xanthomonas sacchari TaxID=56458 RepID=UPI002A04A8AA|nr:hypothetical protein [Xanthomonas sacchari]MCW0440412.1 hypothetical protein [Xanthomonas sacchari]